MRIINLTTLLLIIIGGLNWLLVAIADIDLVATLFGGRESTFAMIVYILVGLSALWQLVPFSRAISAGETNSQVGR